MNFNRLVIGMCLLVAPAALGFVHVSPDKPHLPSTIDHPEIAFYWNGSYPTIKSKEDLAGGIYKDLDDEAFFQQLLTLAFQKWNDIEGAFLVMTVATDTNASIDEEDDRNSIVVSSVDNISTAAFAQPVNRSTKPASEQTDNEKDVHIIHDCDITISDKSVDAKFLFSTLIHEIGHCVGLGHPHTSYKSIMSYARSEGATTLGLDDEAGIIYLYPEDPTTAKELVSCGALGLVPVHITGLLLLLPLLLLNGRRLAPSRQNKTMPKKRNPRS